ncbi:MAG: hypothetical protein HY347_05355 [candidate division NC10 bacterium]|nr:hypothetical protein [candidate division NC10 bacterium]
MPMTRTALGLALALGLLLGGCLQYEEELFVRRNGSGSLTIQFYDPLERLSPAEIAERVRKEQEGIEAQVEGRKAAMEASGITLKEASVAGRGRSVQYRFTLDFKDVNELPFLLRDTFLPFGKRFIRYDREQGTFSCRIEPMGSLTDETREEWRRANLMFRFSLRTDAPTSGRRGRRANRVLVRVLPMTEAWEQGVQIDLELRP